MIDYEKLKIVKFKTIMSTLPEIATKTLSENSRTVTAETVSDDLALKNPGLLCHARWLTTGNRLLRLYAGTPKSKKELNSLVELVIKVYVPVWFSIKAEPFCY